MKRVAIYARVSTGQQTIDNQLRELQDLAKKFGWSVVKVYTDEGISGKKGRSQRPGYDALCSSVARREIDMVMAWSVDRLGRSLQDLVVFLADMHSCGVDIYLHQQGLDTSTPSGRAMFQMMGIFAEYEREIISERVKAGLKRTKDLGKRLGRPQVDKSTKLRVINLVNKGYNYRDTANETGVSVGAVSNIIKEYKETTECGTALTG